MRRHNMQVNVELPHEIKGAPRKLSIRDVRVLSVDFSWLFPQRRKSDNNTCEGPLRSCVLEKHVVGP
jgi:hypothetical protein